MRRAARSYASYVGVPTLLSLQKPITSRKDAFIWGAERFFIICHQTSELWLSQILLDLEHAAKLVDNRANWSAARVVLCRAAAMTLMLSRNLEQLGQFCPKSAFLTFRTALQGLSASESRQFQLMLKLIRDNHPHLMKIGSALSMSSPCPQAMSPGIRICAHDRCAAADAMRILIRGIVIWRQLHLEIAKQFIKDLPGTGSTSGVEYLQRQLDVGAAEMASFAAKNVGFLRENASAPTPVTLASLRSELQVLESSVGQLGELPPHASI
jgi:tryptophan 2,3-dioxygenase